MNWERKGEKRAEGKNKRGQKGKEIEGATKRSDALSGELNKGDNGKASV